MRGRQEDAHEYLRCLVDAVERDLLRGEGRWVPGAKREPCPGTLANVLFQGAVLNTVKCLACGHESNTFDPIQARGCWLVLRNGWVLHYVWRKTHTAGAHVASPPAQLKTPPTRLQDLSLEIARCASLRDALRRFTAPEQLEGANAYKCDGCRRLVPARKQMTLYDDPNVLVIHLKRFDGFHGGKISGHLDFDEALGALGWAGWVKRGGVTRVQHAGLRGRARERLAALSLLQSVHAALSRRSHAVHELPRAPPACVAVAQRRRGR